MKDEKGYQQILEERIAANSEIIKAAFAYCKATHEDDQILLHKLVEAVCSHPDYRVE